MAFFLARFFLWYNGDPGYDPLVMVDGWDLKSVASVKPAFTYTDDSTQVEFEVNLLIDREGLPFAYSSHILTPVCDDTLCALMNIEVYWNLLGNYIGYDTIAGDPLTKNDHLPFLTEDYEKLHRLLSDDNSIIKRKEKHELFDTEAKRVSEVVDAVTGATAKEISEAVVDGALYSCYTLYHIVYGPLSEMMLSDMESRFSPDLQSSFMMSDHFDYQLYILKRIQTDDFVQNQTRILELIHTSIPLNRLYIMKKMPENMWADQHVLLTISGYFEALDGNTQTFFIRQLEKTQHIDPQVLLDLIHHMDILSQNQLKMLIRVFEQQDWRQEVVAAIVDKLNNSDMTYGYLVEGYVDKLMSGKN